MLKLTRLFIGLAFYCTAEIKIKNYHSKLFYIFTHLLKLKLKSSFALYITFDKAPSDSLTDDRL